MRPAALAVLIVSVLCSFTSTAAQRSHAIVESVDLGLFDGRPTGPTAINDRGDVVGYALDGEGRFGAFLWTRRTGYQSIAQDGIAWDVNDRGEVVGQVWRCAAYDNCLISGFVWSEALGYVDLGPFIPSAINNKSEVAGMCTDTQRACVMRGGIVTAVADENTFARGINGRGEIVGSSFDPESGPLNGFILTRNGAVRDLGPGVPVAINNRGVVAGWISDGADSNAAVWIDGVARLLSHGPGSSGGVNEAGWVVYGDTDANAQVWNARSGQTVRLNSSFEDGNPTSAADINNRGEIVGSAVLSPDTYHVVIWRLGRQK